jgi:hypothetical protein
MRHWTLVFPVVGLLVLELIIYLVGGLFSLGLGLGLAFGFHPFALLVTDIIFSIVTGFVVGILTAFVVAIVLEESKSAVSGKTFTIGGAWKEVKARMGVASAVAVGLGIVFALFSFAPFASWLLDGLSIGYVTIMFALICGGGKGAGDSLRGAAVVYSKMADKDGLTLLAYLISSVLSAIPILNLATIPYNAILINLYQTEASAV